MNAFQDALMALNLIGVAVPVERSTDGGYAVLGEAQSQATNASGGDRHANGASSGSDCSGGEGSNPGGYGAVAGGEAWARVVDAAVAVLKAAGAESCAPLPAAASAQ